MAENFIGFGESANNANPINTNEASSTTPEDVTTPENDNNENENNFSSMEERDPTPSHKIVVHVTDQHAPIVMFFGAPSSGKTMTLVRLAKYLRNHGYTLEVDPNFCTTAWEYEKNKLNFNSMLSTQVALKGTDHNDFLFIKVKDIQGTTVCQILEGAGEGYFPTSVPPGYERSKVPFPTYMSEVFGSRNKKIWVFITEPNWERPYADKMEYVERIKFCKTSYSVSNDKFILLFNKVDDLGTITENNAIKACNNEYEGLFSAFKNHSPLASVFGPKYTFKFVGFSTGHYGLAGPDGSKPYTPSRDNYPATLWEAILKSIRG